MTVREGLWRDRDFARFWAAVTLAGFGDQIALLAVPLVAVLTLGASAGEMGVLRAMQTAPTFLFSLVLGVWVDRVRRRGLLVGSSAGRAVLLAVITAAALGGALRMPILYVVAFGLGIFEVLTIVAEQSLVPALVRRERLVDANSKLQVSLSLTQIAGPSVGGILVAALTAPIAVVGAAAAEVVAVAALATVRAQEPAPGGTRRHVLAEIGEGIRALLGPPELRALVTFAVSGVFVYAMYLTLVVLYLTREVRLDPAAIGVVLGAAGAGGLLGSLLAATLADRMGLGRSFVLAGSLFPPTFAAVALASGGPLTAVPVAAAGSFGIAFGGSLFNVNAPALRQALTPARLLGRVNASYRFIVWGTLPFGSLLAGLLGETLGLRGAMLAIAALSVVPFVLIVVSPLRSIERTPVVAEP